jgi:hypothetical protein
MRSVNEKEISGEQSKEFVGKLKVLAEAAPKPKMNFSECNVEKMETFHHISKKLNTHEDLFYAHKILGTIVLCNYIYRFYLLITTRDMNLNNQHSMMILLFHPLLSLSSLFFKISNTRNRKIPIIYPEFRLHNIIFALRSVFCCYSFYFFQNQVLYLSGKPVRLDIICNMFICMLTMKFADIVTNYYKNLTPPTTTMRNMPYDELMEENKLKNLKKLYSYMQFYATYYMLGNINSAFSPMFAIQLSSFLMTLVKKNIIPPMWWHPLYFASLLSNSLVFFSLPFLFIYKFNFACYFFSHWRMVNGYNKYIGWLIVFMFHYFYDINSFGGGSAETKTVNFSANSFGRYPSLHSDKSLNFSTNSYGCSPENSFSSTLRFDEFFNYNTTVIIILFSTCYHYIRYTPI